MEKSNTLCFFLSLLVVCPGIARQFQSLYQKSMVEIFSMPEVCILVTDVNFIKNFRFKVLSVCVKIHVLWSTLVLLEAHSSVYDNPYTHAVQSKDLQQYWKRFRLVSQGTVSIFQYCYRYSKTLKQRNNNHIFQSLELWWCYSATVD